MESSAHCYFFQSVNLRSNYCLQISDAFIALGQSRGQLLHLFNLPRGRELNNILKGDCPSHISEGIKIQISGQLKNKKSRSISANNYLHLFDRYVPHLYTDMAKLRSESERLSRSIGLPRGKARQCLRNCAKDPLDLGHAIN